MGSDVILLLRSLWLEEGCADLGGLVFVQQIIGVHSQAVSLLFYFIFSRPPWVIAVHDCMFYADLTALISNLEQGFHYTFHFTLA